MVTDVHRAVHFRKTMNVKVSHQLVIYSFGLYVEIGKYRKENHVMMAVELMEMDVPYSAKLKSLINVWENLLSV